MKFGQKNQWNAEFLSLFTILLRFFDWFGLDSQFGLVSDWLKAQSLLLRVISPVTNFKCRQIDFFGLDKGHNPINKSTCEIDDF